MKSFQFRADGSRAATGDPPQPWEYSLAALATLYEKYKAGDWLPGALVRMCEFDHPRIRTNPKDFIFKGDGEEVEIMDPYDHYRDGPRCVLGDAEAHQEWKKRVCADYKTRDELLNREELRFYAETGHIPRKDLAAFPLMPSPPTVVIDAEEVCFGEIYKAHREFKIEVKAIPTRRSLAQPHRGSMYLFQGSFNVDPGFARGYVEGALRTRIMLEDNTFPLSRCSFEVRKQAFMANRESILEYKSRERGRAVNDGNERWTTKVGWARDYQCSNGGISLTPPRKTSKKKKKRKREAPPPPKIKYHKIRGGAAKATEQGLQLPQIAECYEQDVDVLVISASKFVSFKEAYTAENVVEPVLNKADKIIVLGNLPETLSMRSWLALCNARVVSNPVEIKNLHLLLQWLPLWWDYPKHKAPRKALPMPDLRSSLETFLRTIPPADEYGNDESDLRPVWIRQLINGAKHLPLFVTACENKNRHALDNQNLHALGTVWDYRDVQISI